MTYLPKPTNASRCCISSHSFTISFIISFFMWFILVSVSVFEFGMNFLDSLRHFGVWISFRTFAILNNQLNVVNVAISLTVSNINPPIATVHFLVLKTCLLSFKIYLLEFRKMCVVRFWSGTWNFKIHLRWNIIGILSFLLALSSNRNLSFDNIIIIS